MQLFDTASAKLKYPRIKFQEFQLYRTKNGNHPGCVYVNPVDGSGWYARINQDGSLTLNKGLSLAGLEEELQKFAADPAGYAAAFGQQTGNCCFCNSGLTDPRSLSVGYGPTCAKHYGLIYPKLSDLVEESEAEKLEAMLSQPFGDSGVTYRHHRFKYTEMVRYLAHEAGCHWLIDAIASWQQDKQVKNTKMSEGFQIWTFTKTGETQGVLTGAWDTNQVCVTQEIEYTDFPLQTVKLWLENNILYFPVER